MIFPSYEGISNLVNVKWKRIVFPKNFIVTDFSFNVMFDENSRN